MELDRAGSIETHVEQFSIKSLWGSILGTFWGALGEPLGVKLKKKRHLEMDRKKSLKKELHPMSPVETNGPGDPYKASFLEPRGLQGSLDC